MKTGQHKLLLLELLRHLKAHQKVAALVSTAVICDDPPGTATFNNKCKFDNGCFFAVVQAPGKRNVANQLVFGVGNDITKRDLTVIDWTLNDTEVKLAARMHCAWALRQLEGSLPSS